MKQLDERAFRHRHYNRYSTDEIVARARDQWIKKRTASEGTTNSSSTTKTAEEDVDPASVNFAWVERTHEELDQSQEHCRATIREALRVSASEHMSEVDKYDGKKARALGEHLHSRKNSANGIKIGADEEEEEDLVKVRPVLDGRLKDIARVRKARTML